MTWINVKLSSLNLDYRTSVHFVKTECLADWPRVENFPIAIQFLATYVIVMGASNHSESIIIMAMKLAYVPLHYGYIEITSKGMDVEVLVKITDRSF